MSSGHSCLQPYYFEATSAVRNFDEKPDDYKLVAWDEQCEPEPLAAGLAARSPAGERPQRLVAMVYGDRWGVQPYSKATYQVVGTDRVLHTPDGKAVLCH